MTQGSFAASLKAASDEVRHRNALVGKARVTCGLCAGSGYEKQGFSDCDSHGSFWVPGHVCTACCGSGGILVPCAPADEVAAVEREIAKLRVQLKAARKHARRTKAAP